MAYLLLLGYVLFFADYFGRTGHSGDYRYNLTLFQEINRYYSIGQRSGMWNLFFLNVCGNVVVFIPLGIFLPMLFKKCKNIFFTILLCFEFTLSVEVIQLATRVGSFDVDDILLNVIGGLSGFLLYTIVNWYSKLGNKRKNRK